MDDLRKHHVTIIGIVAIVAIVAIVLGIFEINTFRNENIVGEAATKFICIDSDGGINYTVQGTVTAGISSATDSCSGSTLTEYYCSTGKARQTNPIGSKLYSCPSGICSNGACVTDTTPPTVSITSPASGATVSGTISVSASASDNVGVIGVQFKLDGLNLWAEVTSSPYSVSWDTTTASNTVHTLSATARDAAGNFATSIISVTVSNNVDTTPPVISNGMPVGTLPSGTTTATLSVTTNENANCKYSTTSNVAYSSMTNGFTTTGATTHSTAINGLANGNSYNYYVKCQDVSGNANVNDYVISFSVASSSSGNIINAASCNQVDVQNAINAAKEGDTVMIPSGSCSWTSTNTVSKAITLSGAGIDQTIIQDNEPSRNPILVITTSTGKFYRFTALTVSKGTVAGTNYDGVIRVTGSSTTWRIDHIKCDQTKSACIGYDGSGYGLIDHNTFNLYGTQGVNVRHTSWGGASYGDGSWADDTHFGTEKAVYIEDNKFTNTYSGTLAVLDFLNGARIVFRHNSITNSYITNHGTDTTQRYRSSRSFEIYENNFTFSGSPWFSGVQIRGGTGLLYNNVFSNYDNIIALANFRDTQAYTPWDTADGTGLWDNNDGIVYASGTYTGVNGSSLVLTDNTKSWAINQWANSPGGKTYSIRNVNQGWGSYITANTETNITASKGVDSQSHTWNVGDTYQILSAYPALDQVGRGKGDLLGGTYNNPLPTGWLHQALEPVYIWGNSLNGNANSAKIWVQHPHIQIGRDAIVGNQKPGYTVYIYPHPLVTGTAP